MSLEVINPGRNAHLTGMRDRGCVEQAVFVYVTDHVTCVKRMSCTFPDDDDDDIKRVFIYFSFCTTVSSVFLKHTFISVAVLMDPSLK